MGSVLYSIYVAITMCTYSKLIYGVPSKVQKICVLGTKLPQKQCETRFFFIIVNNNFVTK
jgi:hypothetical protein